MASETRGRTHHRGVAILHALAFASEPLDLRREKWVTTGMSHALKIWRHVSRHVPSNTLPPLSHCNVSLFGSFTLGELTMIE